MTNATVVFSVGMYQTRCARTSLTKPADAELNGSEPFAS